ncbi:MAG: hypothetical protein KBS93_03090 [Flavobacteriaceae bacterium]|nr:hypothetical protein [Candidatus Onthonaster equi]
MKVIKLITYFTMLMFVGFTTISCLNDDDSSEEYTSYGFVPASKLEYNIDSVGPIKKPTNIHVTFELKGDCQDFVEFKDIASSASDVKNFGVFGSQKNNSSCTNDIRIVTKTYRFVPTKAGENTIRVWAGKLNGEDIYISETIQIPAE